MIEHLKKDFADLFTLYILAVIFLVLVSLFAVPLQISKMGIFTPTNKNDEIRTWYNPQAFDNISVTAKSYIVYDVLTNKIISGKNEHVSFPLASITKVMMALTAVVKYPPSTKITVTKGSLDGSYDLGLKERQSWTLKDLLKYTLVFSSNDGAQLIADKLAGRVEFVEQMNAYSSLLGLNMKFTQPAGLDLNGQLGGIGSAYDVARMMSVARVELGSILDATTKTRLRVNSSTGTIHGIPNTNQQIDKFVFAEGSKTGYTESAGGNIVLSVDPMLGHPVIIVVLGSTREDRFTDAYELYKALLKSIQE